MPKAKRKHESLRGPIRFVRLRDDVRLVKLAKTETALQQLQLLRDAMIRERAALWKMADHLRKFGTAVKEHKARHVAESAAIYAARAADSIDILVGYMEDSQRQIASEIEALKNRD